MLVLKRSEGESILIGDGIEIVIIECGNGVVKLGIEAPKDVEIVRKELILDIKNENKESIDNLEMLINKIIR